MASHIVLTNSTKIPIWGWAPGSALQVTKAVKVESNVRSHDINCTHIYQNEVGVANQEKHREQVVKHKAH
ncbi:LOW QUALITY PROTEIN: Aldo-keto reductase family 1 member B1 [Plecturocebus cupreus]